MKDLISKLFRLVDIISVSSYSLQVALKCLAIDCTRFKNGWKKLQ